MNKRLQLSAYLLASYTIKAALLTVYLGDGITRFAEFFLILLLGPFAIPLPFFGHLTPPLWTWYPLALWWLGTWGLYDEVMDS